MIETNLIIISGISGTGKSTTARWLSSTLHRNAILHEFLHEECENHPIRENEFSFGSNYSETDMDKNCILMLDKSPLLPLSKASITS